MQCDDAWSLPIFDFLPSRTPSNPPILTPSGVAPATARSSFTAEKCPFHLRKRISPFIHRGEMHFGNLKMGKLQGLGQQDGRMFVGAI